MSNNRTKYGETENRQPRANPLDVAWFAGVFDGEGTITAQWVKNRNKPTHCHVGCHFRIGNTSTSLLEKVQRIVQDICWKNYSIRTHSDVGGKRMFVLEICKQRHIEMLLEAILPHLTVKRAQAEAMLVYIKSRKETRHRGMGYTADEEGLVDSLKFLKKAEYFYVPTMEGRETERPAPEVNVA